MFGEIYVLKKYMYPKKIMPDAKGFLDGFGFILGSQLLGGLIVKVHGGHKATFASLIGINMNI